MGTRFIKKEAKLICSNAQGETEHFGWWPESIGPLLSNAERAYERSMKKCAAAHAFHKFWSVRDCRFIAKNDHCQYDALSHDARAINNRSLLAQRAHRPRLSLHLSACARHVATLHRAPRPTCFRFARASALHLQQPAYHPRANYA